MPTAANKNIVVPKTGENGDLKELPTAVNKHPVMFKKGESVELDDMLY